MLEFSRHKFCFFIPSEIIEELKSGTEGHGPFKNEK